MLLASMRPRSLCDSSAKRGFRNAHASTDELLAVCRHTGSSSRPSTVTNNPSVETMPPDSYEHVSAQEGELFRRLHQNGLGVKKISKATGRSKSTVSQHLFKKHRPAKPKGRPKAFVSTEKGFLAAQKAHARLLRKSKGLSEVTAAMVKDELGESCSTRTLQRAFWEHDVHFRPLYEKPDLTPADTKERLEWAERHGHRTPGQWGRYVHAFIDNKVFPVYTRGKFRSAAAKRLVRGSYRTRKRVFTTGYVKPKNPKILKNSAGTKSVSVTCAISSEKVLMWHVVPGRWNGAEAARMYSGPLKTALRRAFRGVKGSWRVLEDNDPTGYKSSKGLEAKAAHGIQTLDLPRRSPDLNPLDFAFWADLNRRMRAAERTWPVSRRETRAQYVERLRRTAMSTPPEFLARITGALTKRCVKLAAAKGGHFPEGGST